MSDAAARYKNHRFPPEIIARAVWLYYRFPLSLRHVEEMLLERGIVVSYETIRRWGRKHGPDYARRLRRKPPSSNDVWHLDEVVITIAGKKHWLWRAVDQEGYVLDEICPDPPQHQGCQAFADPTAEEAGHGAEAHDHGQAALLRRRETPDHAECRASLAQRPE
ncbi:hypothetical protein MESS2_p120013 [Mesorhizobium metallidurans STM 2683]|uniref:DDE domain-containing protein n=1 Tax=Mesorhizobium metallidurans STM 2683 TaxID=1297569 RepID=M5EZ26_9HYPH|nr:hypothetical protein MESS2_p120013 [Mesorhizobium metallidurans STM 2683]